VASRVVRARLDDGVIVRADALLGLSTAIVAPISRSAAAATFRPTVHAPAM
jgi:hypothetical protein